MKRFFVVVFLVLIASTLFGVFTFIRYNSDIVTEVTKNELESQTIRDLSENSNDSNHIIPISISNEISTLNVVVNPLDNGSYYFKYFSTNIQKESINNIKILITSDPTDLFVSQKVDSKFSNFEGTTYSGFSSDKLDHTLLIKIYINDLFFKNAPTEFTPISQVIEFNFIQAMQLMKYSNTRTSMQTISEESVGIYNRKKISTKINDMFGVSIN